MKPPLLKAFESTLPVPWDLIKRLMRPLFGILLQSPSLMLTSMSMLMLKARPTPVHSNELILLL
jgi:hypothetical protein